MKHEQHRHNDDMLPGKVHKHVLSQSTLPVVAQWLAAAHIVWHAHSALFCICHTLLFKLATQRCAAVHGTRP